jgi:hypothetical protein
MEDLTFCKEWEEHLVAWHIDDLEPIERELFHRHMSECPQCSAAYAVFSDMEARIRNLPQANLLLGLRSQLKNIKQDPSPDAAAESFWYLQDPQLKIPVGDPLCVDPDTVPSVVSDRGSYSNQRSMPDTQLGGMNTMIMMITTYGRVFEIFPEEPENVELMIEDAASLVLADLFGEAIVDDISVNFSPPSCSGQREGMIYIQAQCILDSYTLVPRTREYIQLAVEGGIRDVLKELLGPVTVRKLVFEPNVREIQQSIDH